MIGYIQVVQSAMCYGIKFNLRTITQTMGFGNTEAQLVTSPPYIAGAICSTVFSYLSDRYNWRMPFIVGPFYLTLISFSIISLHGELERNLGAAHSAAVMPTVPPSLHHLAPASRHAVGLAPNLSFGNSGGIMGSSMYFDREVPVYSTGFGLNLAFAATGLLMDLTVEWAMKWGNDKKAKMTEDEIRAKWPHDQIMRLGDKSPFFKYTL